MPDFKVTVTAKLERIVKSNDRNHAQNIMNAWLRDTVLPRANPRALFVFQVDPVEDNIVKQENEEQL